MRRIFHPLSIRQFTCRMRDLFMRQLFARPMFRAAVVMVLVAGAGASPCMAQPAVDSGPARAIREIHGLLDRLVRSGCDFQRNGNWYTGMQASEHLARKLGYAQRMGRVASAEEFILLAASRSSDSGAAYSVRCGTGAEESAQDWMNRQLARMRVGV